jgi:hypothetical protein
LCLLEIAKASEPIETEEINVSTIANSKTTNLAEASYTKTLLFQHLRDYLLQENNLGVFPDRLKASSLLRPINPKFPTVLLIYKSNPTMKPVDAENLIRLYDAYRKDFNFVMIDTSSEVNYYAMLLLKEYWKDEKFKAVATLPNGKTYDEIGNVNQLSEFEIKLQSLRNLPKNK